MMSELDGGQGDYQWNVYCERETPYRLDPAYSLPIFRPVIATSLLKGGRLRVQGF